MTPSDRNTSPFKQGELITEGAVIQIQEAHGP